MDLAVCSSFFIHQNRKSEKAIEMINLEKQNGGGGEDFEA